MIIRKSNFGLINIYVNYILSVKVLKLNVDEKG